MMPFANGVSFERTLVQIPHERSRYWPRRAPSALPQPLEPARQRAEPLGATGRRVVPLEPVPAQPQTQQAADDGRGAFQKAAQALRNRLQPAVEAEHREQQEVLKRIYRGTASLRRLREEGVVLTHLAAQEEGRLYSDFVWIFFPRRAQQQGDGVQPRAGNDGPAAAAAGAGGGGGRTPASELPYHKFQRGDSVLINWAILGGDSPAARPLPQLLLQQQQQQPSPQQRRAGRLGSLSAGSSGSADDESSNEDGASAAAAAAATAASASLEGTVLEVKRGHLAVAVSKDTAMQLEELADGGAMFRLDRGDKDVTTRRQLEALGRLETLRDPNNRAEQLVRVILLGAPASCAEQKPKWASDPEWLDCAQKVLHSLPSLNWSQRAAISTALRQTFSLWQGPPGTGKTRTLLGLMQVLCAANRQRGPLAKARMGPLLAAADTNAAVDNMVEGLAQAGVRVVRVGQPAKVRPELRGYCLDALVERTASGKRAAQLREKAEQFLRRAREGKERGVLSRNEVTLLRKEANKCWDEADGLAAGVAERLLTDCEVVAATCTGSADPRLGDMGFKVVLLDEASQATEPSTLIPLLKGAECVVMAGDIKQLPPTVISQEALKYGLDVPLLARLQSGGLPALLLELQYRMHPDIAAFPSLQFYGGRVKSAVAEADRPTIREVPWQEGCPVLFVHCDTPEARTRSGVDLGAAGAAQESAWSEGGKSYQNEGEAARALQILSRVMRANPDLQSIAILTPYNGQVRLLTKLLRGMDRSQLPASASATEVTVSTVDGYQGREADFIIFSAVRSNSEGRMGFVADPRRLNVALTRARRGLIVLGNGNTLLHDSNWQAWLSWYSRRTEGRQRRG